MGWGPVSQAEDENRRRASPKSKKRYLKVSLSRKVCISSRRSSSLAPSVCGCLRSGIRVRLTRINKVWRIIQAEAQIELSHPGCCCNLRNMACMTNTSSASLQEAGFVSILIVLGLLSWA